MDAAEASARVDRMIAHDPFMRSLGIKFMAGGPGHAAVQIRVKPAHLNFNGVCHGGVIFSLADTAFGLAANSYGRVAAGIDTHATFQVAVKAGDVLTASAREVSRTRRLAVYRVDVTREGDSVVVATLTGTVYILEKHIDL